MKNIKNGALIAVAAGSLFAAACKKDEKSESKPADKTPAAKTDPTAPGKKEEAVKPDPAVAKPDPAPAPAPADGEKVSQIDCYGVNECKGQGTCKTDKSGCSGQNECKGKGVLAMTEEECKTKGGTVANF